MAQPKVLIAYAQSSSSFILSGSWLDLVSATINPTSNGTVHIVANATVLKAQPANGDEAYFGIASASNGTPVSLSMKVQLATDSGINNMEGFIPITVQWVQSVSAGSHTFYLVGRRSTAWPGSMEVWGRQVAVTFIPD